MSNISFFRKRCLSAFWACLFVLPAAAEPTSSAVLLNYVRPYGNGDTAFVSANMPNGTFCTLSFFSINLATNAGKAMYAAALVAVAQKKYVYIEINYCGTGPSGANEIQSLYLLPSP